ncbi:MAG: site-specific integrase [Deltaproteobacteria bacterium]|nr:site-specific integrase [Deltaproteobacteria bacterium]
MRKPKKTAHPGIRRVGEDDYLVRVTVTDPTEGKQKDKEVRVKGALTEAIRAREDLKEDLRDEVQRESQMRTLGIDPVIVRREILSDYSKRWIGHLAKTGRNRVHVIKQHVHVLNSFVLPRMGKIELQALTRRDLVMWMEGLGDLQNNGKPYAKQTLAGVWATFRTMLKDALVLADLKTDPTHGLRFRVRGAEPIEKEVLTREELGRLLDETQHESPDMRAMIWVGFTTGMRFGELSALQWNDIDFERGLIHVRKSQVKGVVGPTKTRSRRTVPLHPLVGEILHAHAKWQRERKVPGLETGFLFLATKTRDDEVAIDVDGDPVAASNAPRLRFSNVLTKPLARCAERAGLRKHVTSHTMRRTFNNLARQAAGDIVARSMTGHTTTAMTEHYSHVTLEEKNKAVAKALGLLGTTDAETGKTGISQSN